MVASGREAALLVVAVFRARDGAGTLTRSVAAVACADAFTGRGGLNCGPFRRAASEAAAFGGIVSIGCVKGVRCGSVQLEVWRAPAVDPHFEKHAFT